MPDNPTSISSVRKLFMPDELFEFMAERTNRAYEKRYEGQEQPKGLKWKNVTGDGIKKMLGMLIAMSYYNKDKMDEHWSTDSVGETPQFRRIMSRNRFLQIFQNWTCYDEKEVVDKKDRLKMVRPLITYTQDKFKTVYKQRRELSLNEGMIAWTSCLFSMVYIRPNINRYRMRLGLLCEAETAYTGGYIMHSTKGSATLNDTIAELIEPYKNLWHHIYMHNYYNSIARCKFLLENGFRCCGTLNKNRGVPEYMKNAKLANNDTLSWREGDILIQAWFWGKPAFFISTIHSDKMIESKQMDWSSKEKIQKPECLIDYNKYMKGVDQMEEYLSFNTMIDRTHCPHTKIMLYLLSVSDINAFVVYKDLNPESKMTHEKFKLAGFEDWTGYSKLPPKPLKFNSKTINSFDPKNKIYSFTLDGKEHDMIPISSKTRSKNLQRKCRICSTKEKPVKTSYMCKKCMVPLHNGHCYMRYHTILQNYFSSMSKH